MSAKGSDQNGKKSHQVKWILWCIRLKDAVKRSHFVSYCELSALLEFNNIYHRNSTPHNCSLFRYCLSDWHGKSILSPLNFHFMTLFCSCVLFITAVKHALCESCYHSCFLCSTRKRAIKKFLLMLYSITVHKSV